MSQSNGQKVSWFELFYDLIIVAAVAQSSHVFATEPTWNTTLWIGVALFTLFSIWLFTTMSMSYIDGDSPAQWLLVLLQMLAVIVGALAMGREGGLPDRLGFTAVAIAFATVAGLYAIAKRQSNDQLGHATMLIWSLVIGAAILLVGAAFPMALVLPTMNLEPLVFGLGLLVATVPFYSVGVARALRSGVVRHEHLSERFGLLIIIVLGESFTSLVMKLGTSKSIPNPTFLVLTMLVVFSIWLLYFQLVAPAGVPLTPWRLRGWLAGHWWLMWAAIASATAFSTMTAVPVGDGKVQQAQYWTATPLLAVMLALLALNQLAPNRPRWSTQVHLGAIAVLAALSFLGIVVLGSNAFVTLALGAAVVVADAVVITVVTRRSVSAGAQPLATS